MVAKAGENQAVSCTSRTAAVARVALIAYIKHALCKI